MKAAHCDVLVIGGGFFGCLLASEWARAGHKVILQEKEKDLLQRASYANQARVHNGYHYPRSVLTAWRSRVNFPRFVEEYSEAIVQDFDKLYAIPRAASKVTARQFRMFMERIGAPIQAAPLRLQRLFSSDLIEEVFLVKEFAFDAVKLKAACLRRMESAQVAHRCGAAVQRLERDAGGGLRSHVRLADGQAQEIVARQVFNCTYSQINDVLAASGLPLIRLKHELAEMALIEPPEELARIGVTVMCGPFFSAMPFPARGLHTLSHVRYTPHCSWQDREGEYAPAHQLFAAAPKRTKFEHMLRDSARFLPCLRGAVYRDSLWEVKTILPQSEGDDSRPILFRRHEQMEGLVSVMGGKIDNIYDVLAETGIPPAPLS